MDDSFCTFTKKERLRKRREFLEVYERGEKFPARHLVFFFLVNDLSYSRLGITASRKVGKPVVRNRIKRRLREIFRRNKASMVTPCNLVANVKRVAVDATYSELEDEFLRAVARWSGQ